MKIKEWEAVTNGSFLFCVLIAANGLLQILSF